MSHHFFGVANQETEEKKGGAVWLLWGTHPRRPECTDESGTCSNIKESVFSFYSTSFFSINLCLCSAKRPWCAGIWRWGAPTRVRAFYYCGFPCFHIVSWRHPFSYKTLSLCTSFCKHLLFKKKGYCSPKEKNRLYSISRRIDQNLRTFFWDVAPFKSLTVYVHNSTPTSRSSYRLLDDFDVCKLKEKRKYFFLKKKLFEIL